MTSFNLHEEKKRIQALADQARARADNTGLIKDEDEARYFEGLVDKLEDLSWHYACLENEGILNN